MARALDVDSPVGELLLPCDADGVARRGAGLDVDRDDAAARAEAVAPQRLVLGPQPRFGGELAGEAAGRQAREPSLLALDRAPAPVGPLRAERVDGGSRRALRVAADGRRGVVLAGERRALVTARRLADEADAGSSRRSASWR